MSLTHNERTKLTATFLNGLALTFAGGGFVTPACPTTGGSIGRRGARARFRDRWHRRDLRTASFTGEGAYDQGRVYAGVVERHPGAAMLGDMLGEAPGTEPARRDRHLELIAEHGRTTWRMRSGRKQPGPRWNRRGGWR